MRHEEWENMIFDFLKNNKRKMTTEEIAKVLSVKQVVVTRYMRRLAVKGEVKAQKINNEVCWGTK